MIANQILNSNRASGGHHHTHLSQDLTYSNNRLDGQPNNNMGQQSQMSMDACCIFGAALSCGACLGATQVIDFQTFLVGLGSENECCNCKIAVNVVESIAFGGHAAACSKCNHPRCLACIQFDIDVLGGELDGEEAGPPYRALENCLFCA